MTQWRKLFRRIDAVWVKRPARGIPFVSLRSALIVNDRVHTSPAALAWARVSAARTPASTGSQPDDDQATR